MAGSFQYICGYCGKQYARSQGRSKHYNQCISKKQYEAKEDERLIEFGWEDEDFLTDEKVLHILRTTPGDKVILAIVKTIWNSPRHMNVRITGVTRRKCTYFDGDQWIPIDKKILAGMIIQRIGNLIYERKLKSDAILKACTYYSHNRENYKKYINILETDDSPKSMRHGRPERLRVIQDDIIGYFAKKTL